MERQNSCQFDFLNDEVLFAQDQGQIVIVLRLSRSGSCLVKVLFKLFQCNTTNRVFASTIRIFSLINGFL